MENQRLSPHNAFIRKTNVLGAPGKELMINLRTVKCRHGRCTFCGLGKIDAAFKNPLTKKEFLSQLKRAKDQVEEDIREIRKVSIINSAHSTIEPDVIRWDAFVDGMHFIMNNFPALAQLSLESRVNTLAGHDVSKITRALGYPPLNFMELAVGVESGSERVRNREMRKGLTDVRIYEAAHILADYGWAMRAYFIYNCPGRLFDARTEDFKIMAEFLAGLRQKTGVSLTLYANRGYVPKGLEPRFRDFRIANARETIKDIMEAAKICKGRGIILDADVTGSDEALTNAAALEIKSDFAETVSEFNVSQRISGLLGWLARH